MTLTAHTRIPSGPDWVRSESVHVLPLIPRNLLFFRLTDTQISNPAGQIWHKFESQLISPHSLGNKTRRWRAAQ